MILRVKQVAPPEPRLLAIFQDRANELLQPLKVTPTQVASSSGNGRGVVLRISLPDGATLKARVQALRRASPRAVEEALLKAPLPPAGGVEYLLLVAPFVSDDADRIFRARGVGYVDLSGNAFIQVRGVVIDRRGRPNRFREHGTVKSLFAPKSARVLRTMLETPKKSWTLVDLAERCGVSTSLVQKLRDALLDQGYLKFTPKPKSARRARPFVLSDPGRLLDRWATRYEPAKWVGYYTLEKKRELVTQALAGRDGPGALTGLAAAHIEAPYLRSDRIEVYCQSPAETIAKANLRPAESGATVFLAEVPDESILTNARIVQACRLVSPVLIYLDLTTYPGRGQEQATYYREKMLGY